MLPLSSRAGRSDNRLGMKVILLASAACTFALLATWGYGRMAAVLLYPGRRVPAAFGCALGLALLASAGGVLNALHLARAPALIVLALAGLVLATCLIISDLRAGNLRAPDAATLVVLLVVIAYLLLLAYTTLPAGVYNHEDDLHNYLVRPMRMLATGGMGGNPFSALGVDALGAQSFLQGFVLMLAPLGYAQAFDSLFCVLLCAMLLDELGRACGARPGLRLAAVVLLLVLPPQVINLSAAYSSSAMLLALLYASRLLLETPDGGVVRASRGAALGAGFLAATLAGLKLNAVIFCVVYGPGLLAGVVRRRRAGVALLAGLGALPALAPWLVVVVRTHAAGIAALRGGATFTGEPAHFAAAGGLRSLLHPFQPLYWGGRPVFFYAAIAITALPGLLLCMRTLRARARLRATLWPPASAFPALLASFVLSAWLVELQNATRYTCPLLVALLPCALLASTAVATGNKATGAPAPACHRLLARGGIVALLAAWVFVPAAFAGLFGERIAQAVQYGTTISFPVEPGDVAVTRTALSPGARRAVRALQSLVPPRAPMLTWTGVDFDLDFARNPVYSLNETGLVAPWLPLPRHAGPAALAVALRAMGVRYVLLQLAGIGVKSDRWYLEVRAITTSPALRRICDAVLRMRTGLRALAVRETLIADVRPFVLFALPAERR